MVSNMQATFSPLEEICGHDNVYYAIINACITLSVFLNGMIALVALNQVAYYAVKLLFLLRIFHHNEVILPFWQ